MAVIIQDGIRRMYVEGENIFYYLTMYNEDYVQPAAPENFEGVREGILRGVYKFKAAEKGEAKVQLFGAGPILNEAVRAQQILSETYNVAADVWSVTSYTELRRDAIAVERWNRLHPGEKDRVPYVVTALGNAKGPVVAASDYIKSLPDALSPWLGSRLVSLGTDGFGRSDNRQHLRRHFEVDAESIAAAALSKLAREGTIKAKVATQAFAELGLNAEAPDAATA
jgi:pyruvate dehydrogenase E1 component